MIAPLEEHERLLLGTNLPSEEVAVVVAIEVNLIAEAIGYVKRSTMSSHYSATNYWPNKKS